MNTSSLENTKHSLIIIGSARGVNRFYATNRAMQTFPHAKVINTGSLITSLIKKMDLKQLDDVSLIDYFKILEPMVVTVILDHLEHTDVILDTHFHYLTPGISARGLFQFRNRIAKAALILIKDDPQSIFEVNRGRDKWFQDIHSIADDTSLNYYFFLFYEKIFSEFVKTDHLELSANDHEIDQKLTGFLEGMNHAP